MDSEDEVIVTKSNPHLADQLRISIGECICFSNGCWLSLKDEDGFFWGTNPYGLDWACNAGANWVQSVLSWLSYWDEPRDETGSLIEFE